MKRNGWDMWCALSPCSNIVKVVKEEKKKRRKVVKIWTETPPPALYTRVAQSKTDHSLVVSHVRITKAAVRLLTPQKDATDFHSIKPLICPTCRALPPVYTESRAYSALDHFCSHSVPDTGFRWRFRKNAGRIHNVCSDWHPEKFQNIFFCYD